MPPELLRYLERHSDLLWFLSLSSIVMLVGSAVLVPWLVARAPVDVFVRQIRVQRGAFAWGLLILRNLIGATLLGAGILMLVLPGQGMLTIVAALCLLDLPRKRTVIRRIVARPAVWKALAWIRNRAGKPHFQKP
jgi:hypothetical protein